MERISGHLPLTRRRLLRTFVVGGVGVLLAACAPAPQPTPTPAPKPAEKPAQPTPTPAPMPAATPTPAVQPKVKPTVGAFHGAWPYEMPPAGHWNTYVPKAITLGIYWDLIQQPFAMYYWASGKWLPLLATEWRTVPPDTFEVTLRQGVKWSDGRDLTPQDVVTTFTVGRLENWTVWRYIDRIEVQGNKIRFHMAKPSTVVERYILRERIRDHATYGPWADKVMDLVKAGKTPDSEEWKKLRQDFQQFRPKEMVASGPFKVDPASMTESQLTLVKVPTAWNADKVLFDRIVLFNGETPQVTPVVLAKNVDYATHGFPPATEKAFVEQGIRILRPPIYSGPALYFNYARLKAIQRKEVRQAIAHAFNRAENATVSLGQSAKAVQFMAGFSDLLLPQWIGEADRKKLNPYPYDLARAEAMLKELGFKKDGGVWVSPEGERMEYELSVPAEFADWSAAATNLADQLTRFGIKVTVRTVTHTQHPIEVNEGKFQLAIRAWGAAHPHPHFSFVQNLFTHNIQAPGPGMKFPLKQQTSMGELDLEKLTVDSAEGLDENAQKAIVTKLSLAFNELLPIIPIWERYGNNPVLEGVRVVGWPPDDDPIYKNSPYADAFVIMMMYEGRLRPKT